MNKVLAQPGYLLNNTREIERYPYKKRFLIWGLLFSFIGGGLFLSPLLGFAFFVLFFIAGSLWRKNEPPILAFCISFQWFSIVSGSFYKQIKGVFPGEIPGNLDGAVLLSLIGLIVIAVGIRLSFKMLESFLRSVQYKVRISIESYSIKRLFWVVISIYIISWFIEFGRVENVSNFAGFISNLLAFRGVFLYLLFLAILRQKIRYTYGFIAGFIVVLPAATSAFSGWSELFFLLLVLFLGEWRPWLKSRVEQQFNTRILCVSAGIIIFLFVMGLIWQGGVKGAWRSTLKEGASKESPINKIKILRSIVRETVSGLDWNKSFESLAERLAGIYYFSHVLEYIPKVVPHENGALILRALEHTCKPRFLFPDKPGLGSNSWLINRYTPFYAATEELETSIGLSYMAEFYIDFGKIGMFVPLFLWGLLIGFVYGVIFLVAPSCDFARAAVTVMFPQPFASFEGEIAYLLGGLIQVFLIFVVILYFIGPLLNRKLLMRKRT